MAQLLEYKCPHCGGAVEFDGSAQKLKCPFCDSEFEPEAFDEVMYDTSAGSDWDAGEENGMVNYVCGSCGGSIVCDSGTVATDCPFCDNPVVVAGNVSGTLRPDIIVPFKIDKAQAKAALSAHFNGKRLLPKVFKDENHLEEIKGVYVPLWMFDASVDASVEYNATRIRSWSDSSYRYTDTQRYTVYRDGHIDFNNIPVLGSNRIDSDLLAAIEPYETASGEKFNTAYLAGYYADKYDIPVEECTSTVDRRINEGVDQLFRRTMSEYSNATLRKMKLKGGNAKSKYVLYPVWLLTTKWNGKSYHFAMNGRTGAFAGNLPLDKKKYNIWYAAIAAISAVVTYAIAWLVSC